MSKTIVKRTSKNPITGTRKIHYSDCCFENAFPEMLKLMGKAIIYGIVIMDAITKPKDKNNK